MRGWRAWEREVLESPGVPEEVGKGLSKARSGKVGWI